MADVFEFVVGGTPVSNQTRRRERVRAWIVHVAEAARREWPADALPWDEPLSVAISHYFAEISIDLDNLPKPILDALKGVAMMDDSQVVILTLRKRRVMQAQGADDPGHLVADALATWPEFIHIRVAKVSEAGDE